MRTNRLLIASVLTVISSMAHGETVQSPDGKVVVNVTPANGGVTYDVSYNGKPMIETSPLGVETTIGSFSTNLTPAGTKAQKIDEAYTLPHGKVRDVHYVANELTSSFTNEKGDTIDVIFRVSDRDVGIAYRLSSKTAVRVNITGEKTAFRLPEGTTTFITPQAPYGQGFAGTKPSYEENYTIDQPVGRRGQYRLGFTFPALFHVGESGWALISETGVGGNDVGTRLGDPVDERTYPIAFPEAAENAGLGDTMAAIPLPGMTSWKTITVGDTLKPIVETTASTDLVKPLYEPSEVYKPGRSVWSWLIWQDGATRFNEQKQFIDLAATLKFEYILIDAMWDVQIGREKMKELADYGKTKGVSIILWYNSNGTANNAPQTPKNKMDSAPARHNEMAWMKSIGVKGIKVDFFGGDKQATLKLYEDIMTDANVYGIGVNFHGATLPRGWERMYPNFVTAEATLASENVIFNQNTANNEARFSTLLPFIRNAVAPTDFGPVYLNKRLNRREQGGSERKTTDAYQLASAVIYQSPIQHFGLTPNNLEKLTGKALEYVQTVPTAWDETRFLDGYPARYVALARRSGDRWWVAASNSEREPREVKLSMPELKGKTLTIIRDNADRTMAVEEITVGDDGGINVTLQPSGGAVIY